MSAAKHALSLFLRRLRLRSVLTDDEAATITALPGVLVDYRANEDVVRPDERVDAACLIVDGLLARFAQMASGDRQIISLHIPGDMADLHSVVAPRSALPLQSLGRSSVLRIPHRPLRLAAAQYPAVALAFWRDGIVDAGIAAQSLLRIGRRKALPRLAHLLCELAIRYEAIGGDRLHFCLDARQQHLGDALGLTSVHVNRTMRRLREMELLEANGRELRILDWPRLAAHAEFDPFYLQFDPIDFHT